LHGEATRQPADHLAEIGQVVESLETVDTIIRLASSHGCA